MKTQLLLSLAILLLGCDKTPPNSSVEVSPKDTLVVKKDTLRQYKYKIGEGVEIYNAKLSWVNDDRRIYSVATIEDSIPAVRYDDLIAYERQSNQRTPLFLFTKPANTLLTMTPQPPITAKVGYTVMVDKVPIFNTLLITGGTGLDDKGVHLYLPSYFNLYAQVNIPENAVGVQWDSLLYSTNPPTPRNLPDPRYDKRLIDRLKSDGKLIGF